MTSTHRTEHMKQLGLQSQGRCKFCSFWGRCIKACAECVHILLQKYPCWHGCRVVLQM